MQLLFESPAVICVAGAVALTMAGIVYHATRTWASLAAVALVVLLTALGLVIEHQVRTPREQVQAALLGLLEAIEADDVPGVLARLTPTAAEMRADAERLMPEFDIDRARSTGEIEVELSPGPPETATVAANVFVKARHRRSGMQGGDFARVEFRLVREGGRWLVDGYNASEDWRRGASQLRKGG
ncbi:MAG: hypothetical protein AAF790_07555 [Planctomycetota bacterium]